MHPYCCAGLAGLGGPGGLASLARRCGDCLHFHCEAKRDRAALGVGAGGGGRGGGVWRGARFEPDPPQHKSKTDRGRAGPQVMTLTGGRLAGLAGRWPLGRSPCMPGRRLAPPRVDSGSGQKHLPPSAPGPYCSLQSARWVLRSNLPSRRQSGFRRLSPPPVGNPARRGRERALSPTPLPTPPTELGAARGAGSTGTPCSGRDGNGAGSGVTTTTGHCRALRRRRTWLTRLTALAGQRGAWRWHRGEHHGCEGLLLAGNPRHPLACAA